MTHILAGLFGVILGAFVGYAVAVYGDLAVTPARDLPPFGPPLRREWRTINGPNGSWTYTGPPYEVLA